MRSLIQKLRSSPLFGNFSWVLLGNVLYSACQWGIVLVLAKSGSPAQVGDYAFGMAVSSPFLVFGNFQLRALIASDAADEFAVSEYFMFRMISMAAAMILVAFTAISTGRAWIIIAAGLAQALEYWSDTYYGLMQKQDRLQRITISLLMKGPLALAALFVAMRFTHSVVWAVNGLILGRLAILLAWDSRLGFAAGPAARQETPTRLQLEWNSQQMWSLLKAAMPLGIVAMLGTLNNNVPRYFIEGHTGSEGLGIFSAIASLVSVGGLLIGALGQSMFLPISIACSERDQTMFRGFIWRSLLLGGGLGAAAVLGSVWFGQEILDHVFRSEYGRHTDILIWLMAAGGVGFVSTALGYIMTAARRLTPQVPLLIATIVADAAYCYWAVPRFGLMGAAHACLAAGLVQLIGTGIILAGIDRKLKPSETALPMPECVHPGA